MDKSLLNKFIANRCNPAEIDRIFSWVQKSSDSFSDEALLKDYWNDIQMTESHEGKSTQQLDRIHHTINLNSSERLNITRKPFLTKRNSLVRLMTRVAAILFIPLLSISIYTYFLQPDLYSLIDEFQKYEIISPPGSRTHLELSDGTKVWLNRGSKMIYPRRFIGNTRTVQLVGEGYFEVASNKTKPFIVETQAMSVKAVGTAFNVSAYPDGANFETSLEIGKVVIQQPNSEDEIEVCDMKPGEHFSLDKATRRYKLTTEDLTKYVAWREGELVFKDDSLVDVAERLSRWYNVKVILKDPDLNHLTYTATFIDETLDQVLEMLEIVTPISYTVSKRHKQSDGTFSGKEILIYKKGGTSTNN